MTGFTFDDMRKFATEAWGPLGADTVLMWAIYNNHYFDGVLKPVPLVITQAQPFGKRLAFCSYKPNASGRTITLNVPKHHNQLLADNGVLLHEMVHQFLFERGEDPNHASEPWRREIMRLTKQITGRDIWAGRSKTVRLNGSVVRRNAANPITGEPSLPQKAIARWPHDGLGIDLGRLGRTT